MPDIAELYRAHRGYLVRLAATYVHDMALAEDVVHEVFAGFLAVNLRDPDAAVGYLTTCTRNRAVDVLRRRRPLADVELPELGSAPSAEQVAMEQFHRSAVLDAVQKLPRQQRAVLTLRYYGGLIEPEIAEALRISPGSVKAHAFRGKRNLAAVLTATTREDTDPHEH